jgi:hypothetical protein
VPDFARPTENDMHSPRKFELLYTATTGRSKHLALPSFNARNSTATQLRRYTEDDKRLAADKRVKKGHIHVNEERAAAEATALVETTDGRA